MSPALDIKLDIVLDSDETTGKPIPKYFPGDEINGKIYVTSNQSYKLSNFRLAWTGRIQVQPIQTNKESRIYFDECWKLYSITKSLNKKSNVYITEFVPINANNAEFTFELPKNKTVAFTFKVHVPNDRPLPSCTELIGSPNKIIYLLEAFIDENKKPTFFTQKTVPVYESISTRSVEMTQPQRKEQVFMVSLLSDEQRDFTSAMRVTLPCKGSQPGIAIPVSISIWNNMEFSRRQGISISLYRVNQVISNGRAYTSQGEKVHRVVTDLNITADEHNKNHKVQTVRVSIPIPRGTLPTITFESSQLLCVNYFIRVQIFAQEGVYTTSEGKKSQFMMLDVPFIIGTHSRPEKEAPVSSPTLSHATIQSNQSSQSTTSSGSGSHIFRKSSTSSVKTSSSNDEKKKMKNVFSNLRLYSYKKKDNDQGVSPAVIMTPKVVNEVELVQQMEETRIEETESQTEQEPSKHSSFSGGGVFNLFPDDDDDDEYEEVIEQGQIVRRKTIKRAPAVTVNKNQTVFKLFPDEDDDEDDEPPTVPPEDVKSVQQESAVFNMFEDDDDSDEEEELNQLKISSRQETSIDERVKPNQQRFEKPNEKSTSDGTKESLYKPNTIDSSSSSSSSALEDSEEDDEFDLLGMIARNDKRYHP